MLIPTSFEHLSSQGYTVMPTIMPPTIAPFLLYCAVLTVAPSSSTAPGQIAHSRTSYGFLRSKFSQRLLILSARRSGSR